MTVDRWDLERVEFQALGEMTLMAESNTGDYVLYGDYEALESDYNILRRDYQNLVDKLDKLYKES